VREHVSAHRAARREHQHGDGSHELATTGHHGVSVPVRAVPHPRLHVLTVVDQLLAGGAETVATRIALSLDPARFRSTICSTRRSDPEAVELVQQAGADVLELGRRSKLDGWRWLPLLRLLRSGTVDVVHAHKFGSNLWLSRFWPLANVPVLIAHEHSWAYEKNSLRFVADRELVARAATRVIAVSPADRERMVEVEGIAPEKVVYIPNGVPDTPPGDAAAGRARMGIAADAPVVGTVCRLRPEKGLDVAIRAMAELSLRRPDLVFAVVGDGPERRPLERLAAQFGVRAIFLGQLPNDEVPDLVAAMDVTLCSSQREGMPLAVLEWMAAGKAIVATRVGGIPAMLSDGEEALLVPPGDHAALAAAVAGLLDEPAERERLGAAAQRRQRREFRFDRTVATVEALYESLHAAVRAHS
jgi:glycosyltransferase involved in cell wall biosynthesis